jgi:hypothetical protein
VCRPYKEALTSTHHSPHTSLSIRGFRLDGCTGTGRYGDGLGHSEASRAHPGDPGRVTGTVESAVASRATRPAAACGTVLAYVATRAVPKKERAWCSRAGPSSPGPRTAHHCLACMLQLLLSLNLKLGCKFGQVRYERCFDATMGFPGKGAFSWTKKLEEKKTARLTGKAEEEKETSGGDRGEGGEAEGWRAQRQSAAAESSSSTSAPEQLGHQACCRGEGRSV